MTNRNQNKILSNSLMGNLQEGRGSESGVALTQHPYAESRKRARKKWRQSIKGKRWDAAYNRRPEVKKRKQEYYIKKLIKDATNV